MKISVAKSAGFCKGVSNAVDKALELAEKYGKVYTIGALIHNEGVVAYLEEHGVHAISLEEARSLPCGAAALIRAHGIPREDEEEIRARGVELFDATCPVVKRIHKIISERHEAGDYVAIVGDANHDEVAGAASYGKGRVKIISEVEDLKDCPEPLSVVFQTTVLAEKYEKFREYAENSQKNGAKTVGIFNTMCYTTLSRQEEARARARESDAVVVIGSRSSANTRRLFQVALAENPNIFFVQDVSDLSAINFKQFDNISVVAGASTPQRLIREVTKLMSETTQNDVAEIKTTEETEAIKEATLQEEQNTPQSAEVKAESAEEKEITMEDVMASPRSAGLVNYKVGKRMKGSVIRADETGIYVTIGGKKDGFIDKSDASAEGNYNPEDYKPGDPIEAIITAVNKEYVALSKKEVDLQRAEDEMAEKALASEVFTLKMTEVTKGGLRGRMGQYTVFVPASQIRMGYVRDLEQYKDKVLRLTLMPEKVKEGAEEGEAEEAAAEKKPAKRSRYLFASQRMVLEREKQEKEDAFWNNIHVHDVVEGKVKRFTQFGAFVSVKGFDCLAHISELSWNKISDPSTVLTIGETYDFVVLRLDREKGRISLGYKQLQKKPYDIAAEKYPVGTVIKGKVERIFSYGAFVSIDEGVDGLVHVSQISHNWIKDANEALKVGEEVEAKIIGFEDNRITLSIKEVLPAPEETESVEFAEADSEEKAGRRSSRVKRFEQKLADSEDRKERRARKETSSEPKEWRSGDSAASIGDLFKGLDIQLADEVPAEEEAPKKKATRKKKEDAPAEGEE